MKIFLPLLFVYVALALVFLSCGENLAGPGTESSSFLPPKDLKALSLNSASIQLSWSPPGGASDSVLRGYVIRWGTEEDSVGKATLACRVDSLSPGETLFFVYSRNLTGELSEPMAIRWAPAARFDSAYVLFEYGQQNPDQPAGFHVGTSSTNPATLPVDLSAQAFLDFYMFGGSGQVSQPLSLWSASMFLTGFKSTMFSTVTHTSATLNVSLSAFPDPGSFVKDTIAIVDSTIYYVRIAGENQDVHYARIHVRVRLTTSYPNRIIELRVSLQKTPGVPFAENADLPPTASRCAVLRFVNCLT